jgi:hypothetical protein
MAPDIPPQRQASPQQRAEAEPLVPLLRLEEGLGDPEALSTWHGALSNAISTDLPHDLLALWLYPAQGGVVLLGPEALAQDDLMVPEPAPRLEPAAVRLVEEIVRDAGYGSVAAAPVRSGRRDVGLLLAADLRPSIYGDREELVLDIVAERLAPMLGRLARQWGEHAGAVSQTARRAALLDALARASVETSTSQLYVAELSRALEPLLPHDHLELLLARADGSRTYRLGEHAGGPVWVDPSLIVEREHFDVDLLIGSAPATLIADTYQEPRWPRGYFTVAEPAGAEIRSLVAARIRAPRGITAYLLAGSVGAGQYDEHDRALIAAVAGVIGAQVTLLAAEATAPPPAAPAEPGTVAPGPLDAAELLATGSEFAETTRRVADLAARFLPFDEMHFAIRLSEGDRVALVQPGERRPLPDLALIPVAGTALASVLQGEVASSFAVVDGEARLIVPLRVAGRVHGALVLTARHPAILREIHIRPAQQLADVVAAHLELLRRAALLPPPYLPGWKKIR